MGARESPAARESKSQKIIIIQTKPASRSNASSSSYSIPNDRHTDIYSTTKKSVLCTHILVIITMCSAHSPIATRRRRPLDRWRRESETPGIGAAPLDRDLRSAAKIRSGRFRFCKKNVFFLMGPDSPIVREGTHPRVRPKITSVRKSHPSLRLDRSSENTDARARGDG